MAIPQELQQYSNEADFTARFVIPLLQRLGFSVVLNFHGTREFGKDLVVGDRDRFNDTIFHGVQIKFEPVVNQEMSHDLIRDADEAFGNPFNHPHKGGEYRISGFYAINGGSIPDNSRDNFFNRLRPRYGDNVRLMDGPRLIVLNRFASFNESVFLKERLTGLVLEIRMNRAILEGLLASISGVLADSGTGFPMQRCRLVAVEATLTQPVITTALFVDKLQQYWERVRILNSLLDSAHQPMTIGNWTQQRLRVALDMLPQIRHDAGIIEGLAVAHLVRLGHIELLTP
jgi:hypothetical protein